jgi:adenylate cyclase
MKNPVVPLVTLTKNAEAVPQHNFSDHDIRQSLTKILASKSFRNARRMGDFLSYVTSALISQNSMIKEYHIALDVFRKKDSFDPRSNAIVRVEAVRLRSKLQEYYENEGKYDLLIIDLPKGSYLPHVRDSRAAAKATKSSNDKLMSIAVLPFLSLSGDSQTATLADTITEDLIDTLAGLDWVYVIPRTSVFRFKHQRADVQSIARRLRATILLEGSVRRTGSTLCIKTRLINAVVLSNRQLGTYNAELHNKNYIVNGFYQKIVNALKVEILGQSLSQNTGT